MIPELQPAIAEVGRDNPDIRTMVEFQHYLHHWPGVVVCTLAMRVPALNCGMLYERNVGVLVFALPPRETMKRYGVSVAWELARLWISDEMPRNSESWFISQAVKHVRKSHPEVELLISYADPSVGHQGTIYRAANWISDGRTDQERKTPRFDYIAVGATAFEGKKFGRRAHVPSGVTVQRQARVSKNRFIYWMKNHEQKRTASTRTDG